MNKWYIKVGFYLLSMFFFIVIVMILGTDIPVYLGKDWEFIGLCAFLRKGVAIPAICGILILLNIPFLMWLYKWTKGTRIGPVTEAKFQNVSSNVMSFVASYFFPLVSFNIGTTWRHVVVLTLLFIIIGIIYIKADIYYCNPTLLIFGFRTYIAEGKFGKDGFNKTIIVWGKMSDGDSFKFIPIDNNTCFAYRI